MNSLRSSWWSLSSTAAWSTPPRSSERPGPEDLADHRCVLDQELLVGRKRVEPGGDDPLDRLGEVSLRPAVAHHADILLRVEGVPARAGEHRRLEVRLDDRLLEQQADESCCLRIGERTERHRRGVHLAAAPPGPALQQLGPRRGDDQQRHASHPFDEVVDEVEETLVRPVEVLEDEHGRAGVGQRLEETTPRRERLGPAVVRALLAAQPEQRPDVGEHPFGLVRSGKSVSTVSASLASATSADSFSRTPACAFDHLAERPEADALAVGQASGPAASRSSSASAVDAPASSSATSRDLPMPGTPTSVDELRLALAPRPGERVREERELALASDERRRARCSTIDADARRGSSGLPEPSPASDLPFA